MVSFKRPTPRPGTSPASHDAFGCKLLSLGTVAKPLSFFILIFWKIQITYPTEVIEFEFVDVSLYLDSGYVFLARIPEKGHVLLIALYEEWHGIILSQY